MYKGTLSVYDYAVFILLLVSFAGIGVYFGFFEKKKSSVNNYLYGDKNLGAIPVGLSIYSSVASAITFLGQPSEVYVFGTQLAVGSFGGFFFLIITWWIILPVFCNLNATSPYEYFERRFNPTIRILVSVMYIIHTLIYTPIVIYASTITINKISGMSSWVCILVIGGVCIFYTMLGGIKSVVWTDTLQSILMVATVVTVAVVATNKVGSFSDVWRIADQGGRIQIFNMNPDPFIRTSFWSTFIGLMFAIGALCSTTASTLQRCMCLKTERQARISTFIGTAGYILTTVLTAVVGLTMYAYYAGCDPIKSKIIKDSNDLIPYFILDISKDLPGLVGIFLAGFLSACLSSISSEYNVSAGLIYYDILEKVFGKKIKKIRPVILMKFLVLSLGVITTMTVPLLENSNNIFPLALSALSFSHSSRLGLFLLGIMFPMANSKGALVGCITSVGLVSWICIGALLNNVNADYVLPTSIEKCASNQINETVSRVFQNVTFMTEEKMEPLKLYYLSFCYYTIFGMLVVIIVGVLVSYLTGKNNNTDPSLIAPFLRTAIEN